MKEGDKVPGERVKLPLLPNKEGKGAGQWSQHNPSVILLHIRPSRLCYLQGTEIVKTTQGITYMAVIILCLFGHNKKGTNGTMKVKRPLWRQRSMLSARIKIMWKVSAAGVKRSKSSCFRIRSWMRKWVRTPAKEIVFRLWCRGSNERIEWKDQWICSLQFFEEQEVVRIEIFFEWRHLQNIVIYIKMRW